MYLDALARMITSAQALGAQAVSASQYEWDVSGSCQSPRVRELHARPSPPHRDPARGFMRAVKTAYPGAVVVAGFDQRPAIARRVTIRTGPLVPFHERSKHPLTLRLTVACRKCAPCLRRRSKMWTARAVTEVQASARTWFGTLTYAPQQQSRFINLSRARLLRQGVDFDALPFGEQFTELCRHAGAEVTMYLKRVRKESGASFRYLCVAEHHKSGLPHYHLLVHERHEGDLKHAVLSKQWRRCGFEKWRLASTTAEAAYLCKYLSKTSVARVRASASYGEPLGVAIENLREITTSPKHGVLGASTRKGE